MKFWDNSGHVMHGEITGELLAIGHILLNTEWIVTINVYVYL